MSGPLGSSKGPARAKRRWPLRTWELVVIVIAIALYAAAALAGPSTNTPPAPPASVAPTASAGPTPGARATPSVAPTLVVPRDEQGRTGSPVAMVEQVLTEKVGNYVLADRGLSEAGARGGALQSAELRYARPPRGSEADIYHGIEVHLDADAARERVRTFGAALGQSGFEVVQRRPLRDDEGELQGLFLELRSKSQRLLLWSNRNMMFSLGGGPAASVDTFYEQLPY